MKTKTDLKLHDFDILFGADEDDRRPRPSTDVHLHGRQVKKVKESQDDK